MNAVDTVEKANKKSDALKSGGKKADIFYVFKMECRTRLTGEMDWIFQPYKTELFPFVED